jgi:parvulin-like peptidyl-prolyl isomerase
MRNFPGQTGCRALTLLLAAALAGCAALGGPPPVAVVNGEPLTEAELNRSLGRLHAAQPQASPAEVDLSAFLQRAIDDRLMLQEARRIGLFERPDIREAVRAYLLRESIGRLYQEEVERKVEVSEAELREKFFADYDEVGLLAFFFDDAQRADEAARWLREGTSPAEVARRFDVEEPGERFMRRALTEEQFRPLFEMDPGAVVGPVARQGRFLVVKLIRQRPALEQDFPRFREAIERPIRKLREKERSDGYLAELRTKQPCEVDEVLLAWLPTAPKELAALEEDTRAVARVGGETLSVAGLAAELGRVYRLGQAEADAEQIKRNIVKSWVEERLVDIEALSRHYEESDPVLASELEAYHQDLVLRIYMSQFVVPQVRLDEAAVAAYYEAHKQDYLKPRRLKVRQISLSSRKQATWVRDELARGADFGWLARTLSIDESSEKGGQLGWLAEDRLNPKALAALEGLEIGQVTEILHIGQDWQLLKLEAREDEQPWPLEEVRRQVRADLYRAELEKARKEVAAKLREGATIEVSPERLARFKERCFPAGSPSN